MGLYRGIGSLAFALGAQLAAYVKSADVGQAYIEEDELNILLLRQLQSAFSVFSPESDKTFMVQAIEQAARDAGLIFYDKNILSSHTGIVSDCTTAPV